MTLYLVDDDPLVRASLAATLAGRYEVLAYGTAEDILSVGRLEPGIALIDLALPGLDGDALHAELVARDAPIAVVFLTGSGGVPQAVEAMRRGAVDFLCKPIRRQRLLDALQAAETRLQRLQEDRARRALFAPLNARERQVLQCLAEGDPSKIIAHRLGVSIRTVEMHRARLCDKLGLPAAAATALACDAGVIRAQRVA